METDWANPMRGDPVRLAPRIDQRLEGVPQAGFDKEQARRETISNLTRLDYEHPQKKKRMEDPVVESGGTYKPMIDDARHIIKDQGNVEAFEHLALTDKIRCKHCHKYVSAGHVYFHCGRLLQYEEPDSDIQKQIQHLTIKRYDFLTIAAFVLKKRAASGRPAAVVMGPAPDRSRTFQCERRPDEGQNAWATVLLKRDGCRTQYRDSQQEIGWTMQTERDRDELSRVDKSYLTSREERARYDQQWVPKQTAGTRNTFKKRTTRGIPKVLR